MSASFTLRAELYHSLAEAFANPPEWSTLAGNEWPLYEMASRLGLDAECLQRIAKIPAEPLAVRRARYETLFIGKGRPRFWLYESAYLNRLLGPETFAVARLYREASFETTGAELPDHISNELAFLAQLAQRGQNEVLPAETKFIEMHAGRWLPDLGRALAQTGDEVYAPLGQLLAHWMEESALKGVTRAGECGGKLTVNRSTFRIPRLPTMVQAAQCTLCGFCVQVCPTFALLIRETQSTTALMLKAAACIRCGKCACICERQALRMQLVSQVEHTPGWQALHQSPRVRCQHCRQPMVSQAEFNYVAAQIGQPTWLAYCNECRMLVMEKSS